MSHCLCLFEPSREAIPAARNKKRASSYLLALRQGGKTDNRALLHKRPDRPPGDSGTLMTVCYPGAGLLLLKMSLCSIHCPPSCFQMTMNLPASSSWPS